MIHLIFEQLLLQAFKKGYEPKIVPKQWKIMLVYK